MWFLQKHWRMDAGRNTPAMHTVPTHGSMLQSVVFGHGLTLTTSQRRKYRTDSRPAAAQA